MFKKASYTIVLSLLNLVLLAQTPGTLDNTFGTSGKVILDYGKTDQVNGIAIDANGMIWLACTSTNTKNEFVVARLNSNGSIDNTFGTNGYKSIAVDVNGGNAHRILIQPDGKVLVAGYSYGLGLVASITVVRLNADGTLDTNFGTNGISITSVAMSQPPQDAFVVTGLTLDQNNKPLLSVADYDDQIMYLIRMNTNGTMDNTMGTNGIAVFSGVVSFNDVDINGNGDILLPGYSGDNAIMRFTSSGAIDNTFGTSGVTTVAGGGTYAMFQEASGSIWTAGISYDPAQGNLNNGIDLIKFTSSGALDNTFGSNGRLHYLYFINHVPPTINSLLNQNNVFILTGSASGGTNSDICSLYPTTTCYQIPSASSSTDDFVSVWLNDDGSFYTPAGTYGTSIIPVSTTYDDESLCSTLDAQGRLVMAGYVKTGNSTGNLMDFAIIRLNSNVTPVFSTSSAEELAVYPNPGDEIYTVNVPVISGSLSVRDMMGKEVLKMEVTKQGEQELQLEAQSPGIYFIELTDGTKQYRCKVIKK